MPSVLITAVGGDVGRSIAYLMRRHFSDYRLVGCDARESKAGRAAVDEFFIAPQANTDEYLPWLRGLMHESNISVLIPTSDAELATLSVVTDLPMITAGRVVIEVGQDKLGTARFLASVGIPGPWTTDSFPPPSLPCIIKPRSGQGSKNVISCSTLDQASAAWAVVGDFAIAQELLTPSDSEITCAVYRSVSGLIRVVQLLRKLDGGMTSWARVVDDERITAQCETVAEKLNVRGSINVQLILTDTGPRIFEINPRFSSTVAMRDAVGFQDLKWSVCEFLGRGLPDFSGCLEGTTVVRDSVPRVVAPHQEEL